MDSAVAARPAITLEIPPPAVRVLIADDNPDDVTTTALLLHLEGYSVRGLTSGKALVEQFGTFRPDVVILDLSMPGISGYDAARALRDARQWRDFLVIAVTGFATLTDQFLSRMAGFDHHLAKPADPNALIALIRDYLSKREQTASS
jgi:CheY-like chemotaxis protein